MANVYDEVMRWATPRSGTMLDALDGKPSSFDIDGTWRASYQGHPQCDTKHAFGDDDFLAGVRTITYLAAMLPVGSKRRSALVGLHAKMTARLANPRLLSYGGAHAPASLPDTGALTSDTGQLFFRPALLQSAEDIAILERHTHAHWPGASYPWSSHLPVWKVWSSPGFRAIVSRLERTNVPAGRWEIDPRASSPELIDRARTLHDLDEDAATLFLQYLTLADCADAVLAEVNGFTPARYKAATTALVARKLVVEKKQPRAQRRFVLRGPWETLKPPHPAVEKTKLALYEATMKDGHAVTPLGRLLPLRPMPELFADAFARHEAEAPGAQKKIDQAPAPDATRDWMREIGERPDDDEVRLVYADWLGDHDDPRGELITLQVQHPEKVAEATELIERHRMAWTETIHPYVDDVRFERGFITGVTARPLMFVKHAKTIFEACPLLTELTLNAGPVGPVQATHWRQLGNCGHFGRLTRLDTTSDHYVSSLDDLELLLNAKYLPRLKYLRLGYHRTNEGFGLRGATLLSECAKLDDLRFLELPGLQIGIKSVRLLLESPNLRKLETLRVPYNSIKEAQAKSLLAALEDGLAPALRRIDFSNTIASSYMTAAVERFATNSVSDETQAALDACLGKRS